MDTEVPPPIQEPEPLTLGETKQLRQLRRENKELRHLLRESVRYFDKLNLGTMKTFDRIRKLLGL